MVEKHRILVVEDEENVGSTLVERLGRDGYEVSWAKSSEDASLEISRRKFDLVLMDVGLPDGSGFDVAAKLRKAQPAASLIFLIAMRRVRFRWRLS